MDGQRTGRATDREVASRAAINEMTAIAMNAVKKRQSGLNWGSPRGSPSPFEDAASCWLDISCSAVGTAAWWFFSSWRPSKDCVEGVAMVMVQESTQCFLKWHDNREGARESVNEMESIGGSGRGSYHESEIGTAKDLYMPARHSGQQNIVASAPCRLYIRRGAVGTTCLASRGSGNLTMLTTVQ